jgi:hypothetical protein
VAQGGDSIPSGVYEPPHRIRVLLREGWVQFEIDGMTTVSSAHPWLEAGSIFDRWHP